MEAFRYVQYSLTLSVLAKYPNIDLRVSLTAEPSIAGIKKGVHCYSNIFIVDGNKINVLVEKFRLYGVNEGKKPDLIKS